MKPATAVFLLCCGTAAGQQPGGVMPDWEVRQAAVALEKHTQSIQQLLTQMRPAEWTAEGAPALYAHQLEQAQHQLILLASEARELAEQPVKLTLALNTFFRLDHVQSLLDSLNAGVRRYQNAPLADLLSSAISQNSTTRERLKEYARQLAADREAEWEIANREAQRCRESLSKQPPASKKP